MSAAEQNRAKQNAERDMHRKFVRLGLSLPVTLDPVDHQLPDSVIRTHWVKPSTWLKILVEEYPHVLFGEGNASDQCAAFWSLYEQHDPNHEIFARHALEERKRCVPLLVYGDEGRGPKRGNFLIWSLESPLGIASMRKGCSCDCARELRKVPRFEIMEAEPVAQAPPEHLALAELQTTNYGGHSYATRHLLFGIPHWLYKQSKQVVQCHLKLLQEDLTSLFEDGFVCRGKGQKFFGCYLGTKGDLKHHMECGNLERSYHTIGRGRMMCSLCWAGLDGFDFEDCSDLPDWSLTIGQSRPWSVTPSLALVPANPDAESYFLLDVFHLFKVGLGRDLAGSSIIALCRMKLFDSIGDKVAIMERLVRAHKSFQLFCLVHKKAPGLRSLTPAFLNYTRRHHAAWANSKGSDTMLLLKWILWFVGLQLINPSTALNPAQERFLKTLKHTIMSGLGMFDVCNSHGLWLRPTCARLVHARLMLLLRGYKSLAKQSMSMRWSGYALKPKFHRLNHIAFSIREALERKSQLLLNPLHAACEQNEDLVGKISRLSRKLATRTLTFRLLQRHFLKKAALLRRSKEKHHCVVEPGLKT
eukprot:Skav200082  [mRNA]  locus=scaffold4413:148907:150756:- [translate_table: standard]